MKDRFVTFTSTDIKLFQIECMVESCLQSSDEPRKIEERPSIRPENHPFISYVYACQVDVCRRVSVCVDVFMWVDACRYCVCHDPCNF